MACMLGAWLLSVPVPLHAQFVPSATNDIKLQVIKQEIDEDAAGRPEAPHVEAVTKQFKIDPHLVEDLRARKQGWGEITIRLVLAQEAYKLVPNSYPNLVQALQKIGDLQKQKQSWGEIADELGIDLAPVVTEAQRARQELRAKAKTNAEGDDRTRRCQIETDQPYLAISHVRYERLPIMHSIPDGGKIGVYHTVMNRYFVVNPPEVLYVVSSESNASTKGGFHEQGHVVCVSSVDPGSINRFRPGGYAGHRSASSQPGTAH